jgi:hypothetical protein
MAEHTKTPWRIDHDQNPVEIVGPAENYRRFGVDGERTLGTVGDDCFYDDDDGNFEGEDIANAAFIVRAVNAHDEMVEAIEAASLFAQWVHGVDMTNDEVRTEANRWARRLDAQLAAALSKARGE